MIKLSIPFTKDNNILSLVKEKHLKYIDEIYMPVPYDIVESGRPYTYSESMIYNNLLEENIRLAKEKGLKVSFVANRQYIDHAKLRSTSMRLCKFLKEMRDKYNIDKVVLSNLYIIRNYGDHIREMGIDVELSILNNVDSVEAFNQMHVLCNCISSICLGDSMIHDIEAITYIKENYPRIKLKVIPNHGCLVNCFGNQQHHNYAACTFLEDSNDPIKCSRNMELSIANDLCATCRTYTMITGRNLNEISFIRPEDSSVYDGIIDSFKISGREQSSEKIIKIAEAYGNMEFEGAIEEILDMSVGVDNSLRNEHLPREFGSKRSSCQHQCYKCKYCKITSDFAKSHSNSSNIEV